MSNTFFGFDTSLPALEKDELLSEGLVIPEDVSDNAVDEKNEETFGVDGENYFPAKPSNEQWRSGKGMSIKDILTQEYQKSHEIVSFEEEMEEEEIIENSISQLGLDDDVDDQETAETKSQSCIDDSTTWTVPMPGTPQQNSLESNMLIQDILSPDKRGIWSSPSRSDASSSTSEPAKEDEQPDLLKQLFQSANRNMLGKEARTRGMNVIKAEDIENRIPYEEASVKDKASPVIIERRMPRTPVAPPGFPFPLGTPPSGIPWMPPPGMMPFSPMMMNDHMQRMLAASPNMGILGNMPSPLRFPPGHVTDFRHRMQGTPIYRGRFQRWGPGNNRFQGKQYHSNHQHSNYQHSNYQHRNTQGKQWNSNESQQDDVMKLPPSDMMTSKEKEWLVKIQLMTLLSDDPPNTDYYYVNYMDKKASKMETKCSEDEKAKSDANKESFNKLLDIVEQKREERKYKPAAFEGSLGKPTSATVHHPRKLVDVSSKEQDDEDSTKSKTTDSMRRRLNIYGNIEQSFGILLDIENISKKLLDVSDLESDELLPERRKKIDSLFSKMKLSLDNWEKESVNDGFLQIMCIPKGKKLFLRALQYFNKSQQECAFLSLTSNLQIIVKKDAQEKVLLPLIEIFKSTLLQADTKFLVSTLMALAANKLSQLFLYSFGLDIVSNALEIVKLNHKENIENVELKKCSDTLERDVTAALSLVPIKSQERHKSHISRIKGLLKQPEISHAVEE